VGDSRAIKIKKGQTNNEEKPRENNRSFVAADADLWVAHAGSIGAAVNNWYRNVA
jgi:hypothetical protein